MVCLKYQNRLIITFCISKLNFKKINSYFIVLQNKSFLKNVKLYITESVNIFSKSMELFNDLSDIYFMCKFKNKWLLLLHY